MMEWKMDTSKYLADCVCDSNAQHDILGILMQIYIHRYAFLVPFKENREVIIHRSICGHIFQQR